MVSSWLCSNNSYLIVIFYYIVLLALTSIPALILTELLIRNCVIDRCSVSAGYVGGTCLLGYLFFWIYYLSPKLGILVSCLLTSGCILAVILRITRKWVISAIRETEILIPMTLMALIGICYLSCLYAWSFPEGCAINDQAFVIHRIFGVGGTSADNLLQKVHSDYLKMGHSIWNVVLAPSGSTLADRPPLMAGIVLTSYLSPNQFSLFHFQAMATLICMFWVPVIWDLCRRIQFGAYHTALLILGLTYTGYFFVSSVHTVPKMLSGSLALCAFNILILKPFLEKRCNTSKEVYLGAVLAGLSAVSHFITLPLLFAMGIAVLILRAIPSKVALLSGFLVFCAIPGPYLIVKSRNELDTSRLARWVLTDSKNKNIFANRRLNIWEAWLETYKEVGINGLWKNKIETIKSLLFERNIKLSEPYRTLFDHDYYPDKFPDKLNAKGDRVIERLRYAQYLFRYISYYHVSRFVGLLNIGWLFLFLGLFRGDEHYRIRTRSSLLMLALGIGTLSMFVLFKFSGPLNLHLISNGAAMLIMLVLVISVFNLSEWFGILVAAFNFLTFFVTWVLILPGEEATTNWLMLTCFMCTSAFLVFYAYRLRRKA